MAGRVAGTSVSPWPTASSSAAITRLPMMAVPQALRAVPFPVAAMLSEAGRMKVRGRVQIAVLGVLGALMCAGALAAAAKPIPAYPKGHYTSLNSLPDWGGVWVLSRPAPGAPAERPALKGKYLKDYE